MAATIQPYLFQRARQWDLDPYALMAVALGEGGLRNRRGDVGDLSGGGSYGPFQLYARGALPARFRGRPLAADRWAWSPRGIDYALRQMLDYGAGGLRGRRAINTIIREFERPRDADASVAAALERYQQLRNGAPLPGGVGSTGYVPTAGGARPADPRAALLMGISSFRSPEEQMQQTPMVQAAIANYKTDMRGWKQAQQGGFGGPMIGVTGGSLAQAQLMRQLIRMVQRYGGRAGENPFTDRVDPVHTEGSYHYQRFRDNPRTRFDESRLGRGLDVTGIGNLGAFLQAVLRRFGMGSFTEIFYDPWGQWDSGRYSRSGIGGHGGHIHFSV